MHIHVLILSSAEHPQCQEKQEAQKLLIKPTKKLAQYTLSFCSIEMHTKTNKYFQIFFFFLPLIQTLTSPCAKHRMASPW